MINELIDAVAQAACVTPQQAITGGGRDAARFAASWPSARVWELRARLRPPATDSRSALPMMPGAEPGIDVVGPAVGELQAIDQGTWPSCKGMASPCQRSAPQRSCRGSCLPRHSEACCPTQQCARDAQGARPDAATICGIRQRMPSYDHAALSPMPTRVDRHLERGLCERHRSSGCNLRMACDPSNRSRCAMIAVVIPAHNKAELRVRGLGAGGGHGAGVEWRACDGGCGG